MLVNIIVPFHEPWVFHFLFVLKLFPIGYGPTPSKRKDIVLEQEVVKGFEFDALPSPLLDPKGIQLCQIAEVVWDLEPLPASSTNRG